MKEAIVVGVDGSPATVAAIEWAADDAARTGLPLHVVFAVDRSPHEIPKFPQPSSGGRAVPRRRPRPRRGREGRQGQAARDHRRHRADRGPAGGRPAPGRRARRRSWSSAPVGWAASRARSSGR